MTSHEQPKKLDVSQRTIADVVAKEKYALAGGPFGSNLGTRDYVEKGVPVIRGTNMGYGRWVQGEFVYVSPEKARSLAANLARPLDIVFTQRGTLGQVALVSESGPDLYLLSQSQMKVTVDTTVADPMFLYYQFQTAEQQDYIARNTSQTGVPHTNLATLRDTPILLPSLDEQKRIASILGSFDDKIELNRKMNKTLEELARAIFKAWFVDFLPVKAKAAGATSFPGLDQETYDAFPSSFRETSPDLIPKGWHRVQLTDLVDRFVGGDWGSDNPVPDETEAVTVIRGTDFTEVKSGDALGAPTRFISSGSLSQRKLRNNDIVLENSVNALTRCVGQSILISDGILERIGQDAICASFCRMLRLRNPDIAPFVQLHLAYMHQNGAMQDFQNISSNGIGNLQSKQLLVAPIFTLPEDTAHLLQIARAIAPFRTSAFADQSFTLARLRNLLITKLMPR